jgi:hypothetical protein
VASLIALGSKLISTPEITERFADRKLSMGRSLGYLLSLVAVLDPLHATIEEFAADGYTHVECYCPRCRATC